MEVTIESTDFNASKAMALAVILSAEESGFLFQQSSSRNHEGKSIITIKFRRAKGGAP